VQENHQFKACWPCSIECNTGDSQISQGCNNRGIPIARIGQGNGASPQIWVAVSMSLFQILAMEGSFAQIICTILAHQQLITGFGFMDNTD